MSLNIYFSNGEIKENWTSCLQFKYLLNTDEQEKDCSTVTIIDKYLQYFTTLRNANNFSHTHIGKHVQIFCFLL